MAEIINDVTYDEQRKLKADIYKPDKVGFGDKILLCKAIM